MMNDLLLELPLGIDLIKILLHLLNFLILFVALTFLLYKPIIKFIHKRQDDIKKQLDDNANLKKEAENLKEEYQSLLKNADAEIEEKQKTAEKNANALANETLNDAKLKSEEIIKNAIEYAELEKQRIATEMKENISDIAINIAKEILDKDIKKEDNERIIDECLKEWSENND